MSAASIGGRSRWVAGFLGLALLCGGGCATQAGPAKSQAGGPVLSDVHVEQRGELTVVTLEGVGNPLHTAMQEPDQQRLVVDLDGVRPQGVPEEIALVGGVVEEVSVEPMLDAAGKPFTRVSLSLDGAARHEILPQGNGLAIHLTPLAESALEPTPTAAEADPEHAFTAESQAAPAVQPAAPATPAASALLGVEPAEGGALRVLADGRIDGAESFALENPARLVVDVHGLENRMQAAQQTVSNSPVAKVRVGQHPDKIRIVLDGATGTSSLANWKAVPTEDGLWIGPAEQAPQAAPAPLARLDHPAVGRGEVGADAEAAAAAPAPIPDAATQVREVSYHAGAGSHRVVIVTEGPGSYQLFEPDAETVVVSLPEAALAADAQARIAPEAGGPVSLVMAFQQPEVANPEVRVVITRVASVKPTVSREGANLVVAFAESAGDAAMPPAFGGDSTASAKALAQATAPGSVQPPAAQSGSEGLAVLKEGGLLDGKQYIGRRISLDFKDVDIDDVLRLIAEVSDLNIIAGDDVTGKVTIRLVDVPWDQALDVILLTKGLGFLKVGNVLRIAPQGLLQQESEARLQERRAKEKLEDLVVKFQPVNYATVTEISKMVQRLLSPRGTVNTDARTNTVIIKDIPSVIDESVALIKAIDTPTPQVMIEAKIVEANLDFSRELGMVWGFGVQQFEDAFNTDSALSRERGSPDVRLRPDARLLDTDGDLNNFVITNPISAASTALVNLGAFLLDEQFNVEAQLQAAESTGEGKVISSPRVVTLDNREAEIQQGVAIPFQTFENGDAQLQFVDAVLQLKVKPHITADRSIIMKLEVSRNAPDDSVAAPGGAPAIGKNEAKTETLVRDGQTLVIGGIYTIQKSDRQSRVPFLHSIPVLGLLFKNTEVRDVRKELLIFVTPKIVEMPQVAS